MMKLIKALGGVLVQVVILGLIVVLSAAVTGIWLGVVLRVAWVVK